MRSFRFSKFLPFLELSSNLPLVHRDLSWLQFNERVLAEAQNPSHFLLERVKFLAISASNLDEFFAIRVSSLEKSLLKARRTFDLKKAQRLIEVREHLYKGIRRFGDIQKEILRSLIEELSSQGIFIHLELQRKQPAFLLAREVFETEVAALLPPLIPFSPKLLSGLESLQSAFILPGGFCLKTPKSLPLLFSRSSSRNQKWDFFFLDHLMLHFINPPLNDRLSAGAFRLTRDGDYEYDLADADSRAVPELIQSKVQTRERGKPIRLQYTGNVSKETLEQVRKSLGLEREQVFSSPETLFLQSLWTLYRSIPVPFGKGALKFNFSKAPIPPLFKKTQSLFDKIKEQDLLLHHPYDSFEAVISFVAQAAQDPKVLSIEQTIYRMDPKSPLLDHLKQAAKTKKVKIVIELRARFDELNNLQIASELERAGVQVFYGFGKLKLHAKVILVTRKEGAEICRYTHLSTGNYHTGTAQSYTDLALLTSQEEMGQDARHFFDSIYQQKAPSSFKKWLVAPHRLSNRIHALIEQEIAAAKKGKRARIFVKVNALVDEETIQSLYRASQAGVQIDLVVRGACSLIPGLKGISENIRVISIIDYFLEHSRIYYFESSGGLYLSSADWMPRNFLRRLEIAFPILDKRLLAFIKDVILPAYFRDNTQAKELSSQGTWRSRNTSKRESPFRSQFFFRELASKKYEGTPLE